MGNRQKGQKVKVSIVIANLNLNLEGEMMMKKIGIIVFALLFVASGAVLASPPVPPPVEVNTISTVTDIQCIGTVLESESYTRRWIGATDGDPGPAYVGSPTLPFDDGTVSGDPDGSNNIPNAAIAMWAPGSDVGGPGRAPTLGNGDTAGEIRYEEEFNAIGGQTTYHKLFDTDTGGTPEDLDVDKTFTFVATDPNGNLSFNERVGMTIVSNGFDVSEAAPPVTDVIGGLCPWVQDPGGSITEIPATNESIAMGSEILSASAVQANTATNVGLSIQAPAMTYAISAQGEGFIEAAMAVQIQEGFGRVGWAPSGNPAFTSNTAGSTQAEIDAAKLVATNYKVGATVVAPGLALFEQYSETSSADGQWTFSKSMAYESQIPVLQIPVVF